MRRLAGPAFLLLVSCGSSGERQPDQAPQGVAAPGLECAVDGASDYGDGCTFERQPAADGAILTLRSPTGSFRRLRVAGGNVAAADGAEPARVLGGDSARIEVAIGRDRYRIPRKLLH
jgi:hypothetical protein